MHQPRGHRVYRLLGFYLDFLPLAVRALGLPENGTDAYLAISG